MMDDIKQDLSQMDISQKKPVETIYSGVVSIRNLRIALFLGTLNDLEIWGADIGNAYLEALTGRENFHCRRT